MSLYGTLFSEFSNNSSLSSSLFYFLFFLRRFLYISIILFVPNIGLLKVTLNLIVFLTVICIQFFCYLIIARPFSENLLNVSNIFSELNICLLFVVIPINELNISEEIRNNIDNALVFIAYAIMGGHMIISIIITGKKLVNLIAIKMGRKIVPISSNGTSAKEIRITTVEPLSEKELNKE